MNRQEYKTRAKLVKKMSREGLTEENLADGGVKQVGSGKEKNLRRAADFELGKEREEQQVYHFHDQKEEKTGQKKEKTTRSYRKAAQTQRVGAAAVTKTGWDGGQAQESEQRETPPVQKTGAGDGPPGVITPVTEAMLHRHAGKKKRERKSGRLLFSEGTSQQAEHARTFGGKQKGKLPSESMRRAAGGAAYIMRQSEGEPEDSASDMAAAGYQAAGTAADAGGKALRSVKRKKQRYRLQKRARTQQNPYAAAGNPGSLWQKEKEDAGNAQSRRDMKKRIQKRRVRRQYQEAYYASKNGQAAMGSAAAAVTYKKHIFAPDRRRRWTRFIPGKTQAYLLTAVLALVLVTAVAAIGSGGLMFQGVTSVMAATTYPATDENMYAAENAYLDLERRLDLQINRMEETHPDYDEYRYNVDEISHNPYQLISFLSAKYGNFSYRDIASILPALFQEQYLLTVETTYETVTETKIIRVGESLGPVMTSGYCNCVLCCGIWAGGNTASGAIPKAGHTIAVDAKNPIVPMGTKVVMNGVEYTVEDTGNFARYGVDFDIYYDSHAGALQHGHQTMEAYLADSNGAQSIEVTETVQKKILHVTLENKGFGAVAGNHLSRDQAQLYDIYNYTLGNRSDLFPGYGTASEGYPDYTVSPEAMSDERFANMIYEAEKYLGTPYVWGGYSPAGFDCSGFVSYVLNHCGNGWDFGRLTANGLKEICTPVSPADARPGDLIFFQGTYATSGASHVGIIVGDGMMIHCGSPVQYASYETAYWKNHFLSVGRLP